ncbi:MAG: hypothetical protein M1820_005264 [Bogoriella megaspora]|nr:MAG: hypothetical protein M1820_005264 [Bogoriella megaspora]
MASTSATLFGLPRELLDQIMSYFDFDRASLCSFRVVNKDASKLTHREFSKHIKVIRLMFEKQSLNDFHCLLSGPCKDDVQEIVFGTDHFSLFVDEETEQDGSVCDVPHCRKGGDHDSMRASSFSNEQLFQAQAEWSRLRLEQLTILQNGWGVGLGAILVAALKQIPPGRCPKITIAGYESDPLRRSKGHHDELHRLGVKPRTAPYWPQPFGLSGGRYNPANWVARVLSSAFAEAGIPLTNINVNLSSLGDQSDTHRRNPSRCALTPPSSSFLNSLNHPLTSALNDVTTLRLDLSAATLGNVSAADLQDRIQGLGDFLSATPLVQILKLDMGNHMWLRGITPFIDELDNRQIRFEHLGEMQLNDIACANRSLCCFIARQSNLRNLQLPRVTLMMDEWEHMFNSIRGSLPHLNHLRIGALGVFFPVLHTWAEMFTSHRFGAFFSPAQTQTIQNGLNTAANIQWGLSVLTTSITAMRGQGLS